MTDRERVRDLARQVAGIAASDGNKAVIRRWRDTNALRKPDRAPVYCRPVGAWAELLPEDRLVCADPWLRSVERALRMTLIKYDIGDDDPVEDWFPVPVVLECDPPNVWGVEAARRAPDCAGGSWAYDPPLKSSADFGSLRTPAYSCNDAATQEALSRAHELLGDILPVKPVCGPPLGAGVGHYAANLRGLGQMMMDLAAEPELLHRLMGHIRDGVLGALDQIESMGLLTPNNHGPMLCSDPVGPAPVNGMLTCANLWITAEGQEFEQVSPAMWEQFCLAYQMPILRRFGLVSYGCCENLTHKIDGVLSIPNLRIFVCSAWTDLDKVIDRVGDGCVIMWRQKASDVVFADDVGPIRRHLEDGMRRLKGRRVQIVLRELQTLAGHPDRLRVWTGLAKSAAEKYA